MNKAIFLDRDGVITKEKNPPDTIDDLSINDIDDFLNEMKDLGFLIFCVTNQPDVARETRKKEDVVHINDYLWAIFPQITLFEVCYHEDADNCVCRKPKAGLLIYLAREFDIDLSKSWMIGDRWRDIGAGINAGCKTILIDRNYQEEVYIAPSFIVKNINNSIKHIKENQ